tara:strand:+ start:7041 stop:7337 length:297 start_codon:yes stop_codon:yes gene_type:complete
MSYFAKLVNNVVVDLAQASQVSDLEEATWMEVYKKNINPKRRCSLGLVYNSEVDALLSVKKYASWTLGSDFRWHPPVEEPENDNDYKWDEASLSWVAE